jgi:hypothetical protein
VVRALGVTEEQTQLELTDTLPLARLGRLLPTVDALFEARGLLFHVRRNRCERNPQAAQRVACRNAARTQGGVERAGITLT